MMGPVVWILLLVVFPLALVGSLALHRARCTRLERYLRGGRGPELWPQPVPPVPLEGRWRVRGALLVGGAAVLGIAVLNPSVSVRQLMVPRARPPLVLLLDVSRSMTVTDVPAGRLSAARLLARRAASLVPGSDIALVAFGGEAYTLLPLSPDRGLLGDLLDTAGPGILSDQGTELAPALREAGILLEEAGFPEGSSVLVLSDGEAHDDEEEILSRVEELREGGAVVWTVTLGTEEGGAVPLPASSFSGLIPSPARDDTEGERPWSRARPGLLERVAARGGGDLALASDPGSVRGLLDRLSTAGGGDWEKTRMPVAGWPWFLVVAVLALGAEAILALPSLGAAERRDEA